MIWGALKRFRSTKYHNINVGCIITRLGTVYDQSGCVCVYMDAACGRHPLAQVLRNSLSGHPPPSATTRDTITSAIYSQRREGPSRQRSIVTRAMLRLLPSCTSSPSRPGLSAHSKG